MWFPLNPAAAIRLPLSDCPVFAYSIQICVLIQTEALPTAVRSLIVWRASPQVTKQAVGSDKQWFCLFHITSMKQNISISWPATKHTPPDIEFVSVTFLAIGADKHISCCQPPDRYTGTVLLISHQSPVLTLSHRYRVTQLTLHTINQLQFPLCYRTQISITDSQQCAT